MENKKIDVLKSIIKGLKIGYQITLNLLTKVVDSTRFLKIYKILKKLLFWILIVICACALISVPLEITLWLFPLNPIPLATGQDKEISVIERIGVEKPTIRSLLADSLQVPLKLEWYNIHFQYDLKIPQGLILETLPEIAFNFTKGSPNKYDSSITPLSENDERNISLPPWRNAYSISATSSLVFPYLDTDSMIWQTHARFTSSFVGNDSASYIPFFSRDMYRVYATPHPIAWVVKFILIFIAFYGILHFIIKLIVKFYESTKWFYKKLCN